MAGQQYIGTGRLGKAQNSIAYSGTMGVTSAISAQIYKVRVAVTTDAWVTIDNIGSSTATTGTYMFAGQPEYFTCSPGELVSAMQVSASGILNVTELS